MDTPAAWQFEQKAESPGMRVVRDIGQVDSIFLPADWKQSSPERPFGDTRSSVEFSAPEHPTVKICFYYRGQPLSPRGAKAFHDLLGQQSPNEPPRELSAAERAELADVLGNLGWEDAFTIRQIRAESLNGKPVLLVEGKYNRSGLGTLDVLIDSDGSGWAPQEIYFQAPQDPDAPEARSTEDLYGQYRPLALQAFKSICWR